MNRYVVFAAALFFGLCGSSFGKVDAYRLSWRDDTATTMVVGWNQISGENAELCYGTTDHKEKASAYRLKQKPDRSISYKGMECRYVRLKNLKPDTAYYFVVRDSEGTGKRLWFKTAPATPKPFTFIAGGDSRTNQDIFRKGCGFVAKLRPLFIVFDGDFTSAGKSKEWKTWFANWQATISKDGRIYPIVVVHGNHENRDMEALTQLFDTPNEDQFYSLGFGGKMLRVWILNSEIQGKVKGKGKAKEKAKKKKQLQNKWIKADLTKHKNAHWKMVTYHRPMRAHTKKKKEGLTQIEDWAQLFYDNHMSLILEADTHMVKRTYPLRPSDGSKSFESFVRDDAHGMVFIGEGSWAAPKKPADDNKPWTMASDSFYQFKWIWISPKEIYIRTVKYDNPEKVVPLTEKNLFTEPKNMVFWEPETGKVLRLPFSVKHPTYKGKK